MELTVSRRLALAQLMRTEERLKHRRLRAQAHGPFAKGSIHDQVLARALRGTTLAEISEFAEVLGTQLKYCLKPIMKGFHRGWEWEFCKGTGGVQLDGFEGRMLKVRIVRKP